MLNIATGVHGDFNNSSSNDHGLARSPNGNNEYANVLNGDAPIPLCLV